MTYYLLLLVSASSLECYACVSKKSWDDCTSTKTQCSSVEDQCIKVHFMAGGVKSFQKGCAPKITCESADNPICREGTGGSVTCDISCCVTDNCNAGSMIVVSSLLLLACAVASLLVLVQAWNNSEMKDFCGCISDFSLQNTFSKEIKRQCWARPERTVFSWRLKEVLKCNVIFFCFWR